MKKVESVNLARIEWCCDEQGISLTDLFEHLGISRRTLEALREGQDALSPSQLAKIATFFKRGMLFFLEPGPVDIDVVHTPQFRTLTNQKPELAAPVRTLIERVERQRDIYIALLEELGQAKPGPWDTRIPRFRAGESAPEKAKIVRTWLRLARENDFDSYRQSIESKGVLVFVSNAYRGPWQIEKENPIRGFSVAHPYFPVIVIKKQDSDTAQSFTLMHELGHLILHKGSFIDDESDLQSYRGREQHANAFAGHVLVPQDVLEEIDLAEFPNLEESAFDKFLKPYSRAWGVSCEVILRRLADEGKIRRSRYQAYRLWKQNLPRPEPGGGGSRHRYREPLRMFGRQFVFTVLDALNSQKITLPKASAYLDNIKISDLRKLERTSAHA